MIRKLFIFLALVLNFAGLFLVAPPARAQQIGPGGGGSGSGAVSSVSGTANQVTVTPTTGATVASLPSAIVAPGTLNAVTSVSSGTAPAVTAGTGGLFAATEGSAATGLASTDELWADSTAHAWKINDNNGTAEQIVGTSGGTSEFVINTGPNTFGNTSAPDFVVGQITAGVAVNACHFTKLICINNYHAATCTTAPTFNVFDGASNVGTALTCSTSLQSTAGTVSSQSETQTIAAGDVYGIKLTIAGGTCLTDIFSVSAEIACP